MQVSLDKTYKTKDGQEVRLYAVDAGEECPVHGAVRERGRWVAEQWQLDGRYSPRTSITVCDLVEVRPRIDRQEWAVRYESGQSSGGSNGEHVVGVLFDDLDAAKLFGARHHAVAITPHRTSFEKGEGL